MKNKGFSLIEVLVVVVILGILATISYAAGVNYQKNSRDSVRKKDIRDIQIALQLYYDNKGHYPIATIQSLVDGFIIGCEGVAANPDDQNNWISPGEPWICRDDESPTTYMKQYPKDPKPGKIQNWPDHSPYDPPHYMYLGGSNQGDVLCGTGTPEDPGTDCQYYSIVACLENINDSNATGAPGGIAINTDPPFKCPEDRVPYEVSGEKGST